MCATEMKTCSTRRLIDGTRVFSLCRQNTQLSGPQQTTVLLGRCGLVGEGIKSSSSLSATAGRQRTGATGKETVLPPAGAKPVKSRGADRPEDLLHYCHGLGVPEPAGRRVGSGGQRFRLQGVQSLFTGLHLCRQRTEYFLPLFSQQPGHWLVNSEQQSYQLLAFMTQHGAKVVVTFFHPAVLACGRHTIYFPTTTTYLPRR